MSKAALNRHLSSYTSRASNLVLVGNLLREFWWRRPESNFRVKNERNECELPPLLPQDARLN